MSTYHGNLGIATIGSTSVVELTGFDYNDSCETADDSAAGDVQRSCKTGKIDGGGSVKFHYNPTDFALFAIGTSIVLTLYPSDDSSGCGKLTGTVVVTDRGIQHDQDGIVEATATFKNALTHSVVAP